jgi:hypothetical protein
MRYWLTGIAYVAVGFFCVMYAPRASGWFKRLSLKILDKSPWVDMTGPQRDRVIERMERSRLHVFERAWMIGIRVMGLLLMIAGFLVMTVR